MCSQLQVAFGICSLLLLSGSGCIKTLLSMHKHAIASFSVALGEAASLQRYEPAPGSHSCFSKGSPELPHTS